MSPQKQLAQKLNATFSTGPRTEAGKAQSSQNRVTHGLCAKKHAIHISQRPEFERHYNEMLAALAPVGAEEAQLSEAIILDQYRLARARDLENEIFIKGIADAKDQLCPMAETWAKNAKDLALLSLYSQRIHRVLIRNQADLAAKQAARKAAASHAPTAGHPTTATLAPTPDPQLPTPELGFLRSNPQEAHTKWPAQASATPPTPHSETSPPVGKAQIAA
jgi:hypothetical protein